MTKKQFATENANKYFYGNSSNQFYGLGTNEIAGRIVGYNDGHLDLIIFVGSPALIGAFEKNTGHSPQNGVYSNKIPGIIASINHSDCVFGREMKYFGRIIEHFNKSEIEKLIKALEL